MITLILGSILLIILASMAIDQSKFASIPIAIITGVLLIISGVEMGNNAYNKKLVVMGLAEWVQVTQEDGSVTNEFRYILHETE